MEIIEIRPLGSSSSSSSSSSGRAFQVSELRRQCKPLKRFKHVAVRALAETNSNGSFRRSRKQTKEVIMVDPLEAKRLAAEEWKLLQARAALQRQQQIEAINGGWAVLGLTAAIVIEGYTGKGILQQVAGYLDSIADFITGLTPVLHLYPGPDYKFSNIEGFCLPVIDSPVCGDPNSML